MVSAHLAPDPIIGSFDDVATPKVSDILLFCVLLHTSSNYRTTTQLLSLPNNADKKVQNILGKRSLAPSDKFEDSRAHKGS
jgi:hypothetical protein